jgi:hypothetical protein
MILGLDYDKTFTLDPEAGDARRQLLVGIGLFGQRGEETNQSLLAACASGAADRHADASLQPALRPRCGPRGGNWHRAG